jgi:hypothetical protein
MKTKERRETSDRLRSLGPDEQRMIIATGKFVGEGFDEWEWSGTADDALGCFHTYVSQDRALVESGNGHLFSFDVPTMDLIEELSLDLPARKSFHMRFAGRSLVGVACRERRQSPMHWKDTLVIFDTPRL